MSQLFVQASQLLTSGTGLAGQWTRGIPTPGITYVGPVPAVGGIATCQNLLQDSPPTLLERFEIYSFSIGWAAVLETAAAAANLTAELALLKDDRVAYIETQTQAAVEVTAGPPNVFLASGAWTADLVNPIELDARDRLSLRAGVRADQAADAANFPLIIVGTSLTNAGGTVVISPYESTLSYRTLAMPASRRL